MKLPIVYLGIAVDGSDRLLFGEIAREGLELRQQVRVARLRLEILSAVMLTFLPQGCSFLEGKGLVTRLIYSISVKIGIG